MLFVLFFCSAGLSNAWAEGDAAILQNYCDEAARLKNRTRDAFSEASRLACAGAEESQYLTLLQEIKTLRKAKEALDEKWRKSFAEESVSPEDGAAPWDVGEIALSQFVMEYGASDFLYVIPQELNAMKLSLFSGIPLPRDAWSDMVEMILVQNGVGVKKLNPFVKQLYILKLDPSAIEGIASREEDLFRFEAHARIFFMFSPKPEQVRSVQAFFERFSDPKQTTVQTIASKVVLVSTKDTVEKLLGLYRAIWDQDRGKVVRLVNLTKVAAAEAEKILKAVFGETASKPPRGPYYPSGGDELSMLVLPQGLALIGEADAVERGERILHDLELQMENPSEKVVFWYTCKHSNPEDIASVLEHVYDSLMSASMEKKQEPPAASCSTPPPVAPQQIKSDSDISLSSECI